LKHALRELESYAFFFRTLAGTSISTPRNIIVAPTTARFFFLIGPNICRPSLVLSCEYLLEPFSAAYFLETATASSHLPNRYPRSLGEIVAGRERHCAALCPRTAFPWQFFNLCRSDFDGLGGRRMCRCAGRRTTAYLRSLKPAGNEKKKQNTKADRPGGKREISARHDETAPPPNFLREAVTGSCPPVFSIRRIPYRWPPKTRFA